jgi:predicted RNA-binding Zn-ribbon protein involved in translation (DUF1610 family)
MESNDQPRKCPKCGGDMEVGFIRDRSHGAASRAAEWAGGVPESSWFGQVRMGDAVRYQVEAFRCEKCGFLEQYAVGPQKPGIL